jgi:hypothetical protein
MIPGLSGSLLSADALEHVVPDRLHGRLDELNRGRVRRRMRAWHLPLRSVLGPASAPRTVFDRLAVPLFSQLGYRIVPIEASSNAATRSSMSIGARLDSDRGAAAALVVTAWGHDAASAWRDAILHGIGHGVRWCFCLTGPALRVVDAVRTYSRRFVEIDVASSIDNDRTFAVFWGLLRADAMQSADGQPLLDRAVAISEEHRAAVRSSLQDGVHHALTHLHRALSAAAVPRRLRTRRADGPTMFDEALQIVYRILFLLFAEARGLVPRWHPTYRDGYTIEALRGPVELMARPRGVWETLQSIARLAHRGCRIGPLRVTAFNGHLFSPLESPLADVLALDDGAVRQALLSLTTRESRAGRQRIAYGDLGVEQLGGVYERLLDLEPPAGRAPARPPAAAFRPSGHSDRRKATGSFYTPRPLTEFLVRRTLAPLVHGAASDEILALRVLDPAMGSGAFLVAACRYLATAYESALLREGAANGEDIGERDRAGFRRTIAQRCLYGVDLNPTAVQLGRLSLWLATLSSDRPLTFLDHRLRAGNSLVGAAPADLTRDPRARASTSPLPLFDDAERDVQIRGAIGVREAIALEPGDTLAQVRGKEQALAKLLAADGALTRWKSACDVWCAACLRHDGSRRLPAFAAVLDAVFERSGLPAHTIAPVLEALRAAAAREHPFHWTLEFPEVFHLATGAAIDSAGFDAVLGNPPWEMLRGDRGDETARAAAKADAGALTAFARRSGIYRLQGDGHANSYQLFLERMLSLLRRGGRLGVIIPWGLAADRGAACLRRHFLDRTSIDTLISVENRGRLFPIHRSLKFLLLCATAGAAPATSLPCRFGIRDPDDLERVPELGPDPGAVEVPRRLIERMDAAALAIPDIRSAVDVDLLSQIVLTMPALGDADGWNVHFGRELNASDDRIHFEEGRAQAPELMPIVEGKHVAPFSVAVDSPVLFIRAARASMLLDPERTFARARLAYRDVASSTNRLTLIAAIIPPAVVTTHTLFCVKERLDADSQLYLCAMLNSFVANYVVRMRVTTHVGASVIERLPVPLPRRGTAAFRRIVRLAATLTDSPADGRSLAELQACTAHAYGLDRAQFDRVLATFPLIPTALRDRAASCFCDIVD